MFFHCTLVSFKLFLRKNTQIYQKSFIAYTGGAYKKSLLGIVHRDHVLLQVIGPPAHERAIVARKRGAFAALVRKMSVETLLGFVAFPAVAATKLVRT